MNNLPQPLIQISHLILFPVKLKSLRHASHNIPKYFVLQLQEKKIPFCKNVCTVVRLCLMMSHNHHRKKYLGITAYTFQNVANG